MNSENPDFSVSDLIITTNGQSKKSIQLISLSRIKPEQKVILKIVFIFHYFYSQTSVIWFCSRIIIVLSELIKKLPQVSTTNAKNKGVLC